MMGKNPLCMSQYLKLLGSCRIPQPVRDHVVVAPKGMSKHVIVAYKNEVSLWIHALLLFFNQSKKWKLLLIPCTQKRFLRHLFCFIIPFMFVNLKFCFAYIWVERIFPMDIAFTLIFMNSKTIIRYS